MTHREYATFASLKRNDYYNSKPPNGGLFALLWLVVIISINLGIGLVIPNVDNSAHVGGLLSGCLLGWFFAPLYRPTDAHMLVDTHRLVQRWPLAVLTVSGTLLAIIALYLYRIRS